MNVRDARAAYVRISQEYGERMHAAELAIGDIVVAAEVLTDAARDERGVSVDMLRTAVLVRRSLFAEARALRDEVYAALRVLERAEAEARDASAKAKAQAVIDRNARDGEEVVRG